MIQIGGTFTVEVPEDERLYVVPPTPATTPVGTPPPTTTARRIQSDEKLVILHEDSA